MISLVEKELDRLMAEGIIEPVQFADWAVPIVPVLKQEEDWVRICGAILNSPLIRCLNRTATQFQELEDLFGHLVGGKLFTHLDLSQMY